MKINRILRLVLLLCIAGAILMCYFYWWEMQPREQAESTYEEVRRWAFQADSHQINEFGKENIPRNQQEGINAGAGVRRIGAPDFDSLLRWNADIVGWIYSPGTSIDYPIVQGADNDFYLNHTVDKKKNIVGSIFMESVNAKDFSDDITILYGHHIKQGKMFSSLSGYKNQSYFNQHPTLILYTPARTYDVLLFAGNTINGDNISFPINFATKAERQQWIDLCLQNSTFHSKIKPDAEDRIIVLCTCTYEYKNARYVVYGILREQQQDEVDNNEE